MKLYTTVKSERNTRPARKGDDNSLQVEITNGNAVMADMLILQKSNMITMQHRSGILIVNGKEITR